MSPYFSPARSTSRRMRCALEEFLAAFGQPNTAIGSRKQGDIELVLEPLDVPGQSRLEEDAPRRG